MQCCMLHTAIVPVYRHPILKCLFACKHLVVIWINIAKEIPGRSCPLRHSICLALCFSSALRTCCFYPVAHCCKRRFSCICRHITVHLGKFQRQLALIKWNIATTWAFYNRNRFSPIALTGKYPVTQFIIYFSMPNVFIFQPLYHCCFCFFYFQSVQELGIAQLPCGNICKCFVLDVTACHDFHNRDIKLFGKIPVSCIMCRYRHNRACTI